MEQRPHHRAESAPLSWRSNQGRYPRSGVNKRHGTHTGGSGDLPSSFCGRGSGSIEKMTRRDYENLEQEVSDYFGKKFQFQAPSGNWELPNPTEMFVEDKWQIEQLQQLKKELNKVKSKLDLFNLNDWHKHTRSMNKAGDIQWRLRKEIDPEFVTQAWCKFYENAKSFPLVPLLAENSGCLNSVHLCEAPGAFITSLNHYLKLHYPNMKWNWQASTLNPYYEGNPLSCMINDDRFILQTLKHWKFGLDFTGDLMKLDNMLGLVKDSQEMGDVLLVTADGSIDCQEDPGEQECIVSSLHYCEAVAALHVLSPGGSFLLKMFTMYEYETVSLMYLLNCSFKSVNVNKPATSKEGNSEVYVVCLEYKGREVMEPWLKVLRNHFGPCLPVKAMFPLSSIPKDFLDQLYSCASKFKDYQTNVIETNIRFYEGHRKHGEDYLNKKLRYLISNHFMELYEMRKLSSELDEVVGKSKLKKTMTLNMDPREEAGSFEDRRKKATLEPLQLLKILREEVENMKVVWPFEDDCTRMEFPVSDDSFEIQTGKPVKSVQSSKFCLGRLLKIRNQVREIARKFSRRSLSSSSSISSSLSSTSLNNGEENCAALGLKSSLSERFRKECPRSQLTILNYKEKLWTSMEGENEGAQLNAFWDIMDVIDALWRDDNLLLQGYPMLTQFNVGMVYMLCHLFDEVGFVKPDKQDFGVIFFGFRKWNPKMRKFLDKVDGTMQKLEDDGGEQTVLSLFPINKLCERYTSPDDSDGRPVSSTSASLDNGDNGSGDCRAEMSDEDCDNLFYKCVTEVNHLCVKEQVLDIIDNILQQN